MTDTNPGCWPDKPGVPKDPELDRWHWLLVAEGEPPVAVLWHKQMWNLGYIGMPAWVFSAARYLGPCHTPAEVAALVEAARREGAGLWLTMHSAPRNGSPILMARENGFAERMCWLDIAGITLGWHRTDCRPREASWFVSPENEHAWRWRPLPQPWSRARGDA
jgi:hypothetical protein